MPRILRDLSSEGRDKVRRAIRREATEIGWTGLNNREKTTQYAKWKEEYDLTHYAIKDWIMKGFKPYGE